MPLPPGGGAVAMMLDNPSGSAGLVRDGRLKGFAVTRRSVALPDVPTFDSQGVKARQTRDLRALADRLGIKPE